MKKIVRNAIRCKHCGDIIERSSVHDYKECSCGSCSVDGGHEYLRRGYKNSPEEDYEDLYEYADVPGYHVEYKSKLYSFGSPYETDLAEPLDKIFRRFPQSSYYLKITDENGNIILDTIS